MGIYDDLLAIKGSGTPFDKLVPIASDKAGNITSSFGSVPQDYISFLLEIGAGELGDSAYMIYDGLLDPEEIDGELSPKLENVLVLGDDFQGFNAGFNISNWSVVEIDLTNMSVYPVAPDFQTFIRGKLNELT